MKHDPAVDHTLREQPPNENERNAGMLTAGVIALVVMGAAIYWVT